VAAVARARYAPHPYGVKALVVQREMWLVVGNDEQHLLPGDTFALERGVPRSERYGRGRRDVLGSPPRHLGRLGHLLG